MPDPEAEARCNLPLVETRPDEEKKRQEQLNLQKKKKRKIHEGKKIKPIK